MKAYADYKPSGVEWLGEVPSHWEMKPLNSLFKRIKLTNFPQEMLLSVYRDYGVIPKDSRDDNHNVSSEDLTPYQLVDKDFLVVNKMKAWQGSLAISKYRGIVSPAYYVYKPLHHFNSDYLHNLLRSIYYIQYYKNSSKGIRVGQWDLDDYFFNRIKVLIPPLAEQQKIAQFLDTKTAQIDALITEQNRLIELLTEQRKAVISHAVTKGLNPNAPMKKSGVEWLGEVPSGWEICQLRHLFSFNKGLTITKENLQENGIPCVNYGEIHSKFGFEVNPQIHQLKCVSENYLQDNLNSLLEYGDFIFADTSEDLEGSGNFTYLNSKIPTFAGYHTIIAKPKNKNLIRFYAYLFHSEPFRKQIRMSVKGIKVFSITQAILKSCFVWLPNEAEQNEIVNYLDQQTAQIDALITEQKELIERLKEYRTALISAAVTGKIDIQAA